MKKESAIKYPHSANLFRFCRKVLDHKYGGIRVIDQDVGQILGFDPADCSHWKKGKKNIRSIQAMKNIAEHLGIDEKLVVDVANGDLNELEAFFEFNGYGVTSLDSKQLENAKKEYFRTKTAVWTKDTEKDFKNQFRPDHEKLNRIVANIHQKIKFQEAPLYLPEIIAYYPNISLKPVEDFEEEKVFPPLKSENSSDRLIISYAKGSDIKPYMRFQIAKAMASYFTKTEEKDSQTINLFSDHIKNIESNLFAAKLLAPAHMIRQEVKKLNPSLDLITQLADTFWVSKSFVNKRLKEILADEE